MTVPVILLGGGLGAGKTTLLRHLLSRSGGRRIALVVNEFGALGIDGALLAGSGADMVELSNGCVCCATGGDLAASLRTLLRGPRPDAIVVELSGVADPYPVLEEVAAVAAVSLRRVVTMIDLDLDPTSAAGDLLLLRRLAAAGTIVLNKADRADGARAAAWRRIVEATRPAARVLVARFGEVPPEAVLDGEDPLPAPQAGKAAAHVGHASAVLELPDGLPRQAVEGFLAREAQETGLERAKGFLRLLEGSFVVQAVRGRFTFAPARPEHVRAPWNRLVVIGAGLDARALRTRAEAAFALCTQDVVHKTDAGALPTQSAPSRM